MHQLRKEYEVRGREQRDTDIVGSADLCSVCILSHAPSFFTFKLVTGTQDFILRSICRVPSREELEEGALLVNLCSPEVFPRLGVAYSLCASTGIKEAFPICVLQLLKAEKANSSWVNSK